MLVCICVCEQPLWLNIPTVPEDTEVQYCLDTVWCNNTAANNVCKRDEQPLFLKALI